VHDRQVVATKIEAKSKEGYRPPFMSFKLLLCDIHRDPPRLVFGEQLGAERRLIFVINVGALLLML
jgi:hypothetical protein